jgi:hypothetical protein
MALKTGWIAKGFAAYKKMDAKMVFKSALEKLAATWYQLFMPKHFTPAAKSIYGYRIRTPKWVRFITKKYPDWEPNMASKDMARAMFSGYRAQTKATSNDVGIKIRMKRGHPTQNYVAKEVVKINQNELNQLMREFKSNSLEGFKNLNNKEQANG